MSAASAPSPTRSESPAPWALVVLLGLLSAFGPFSTDMYLPGLPRLADDLSASTAATQVTLTTSVAGIAVGQLVAGAVSDARGRRPVLLTGLAAYAVASVACAVSPDVWTLSAVRFLQGMAGGVGIVLARAIVRDRYTGIAAAQTLSALLLVNGVAPIVSPIAGGQLLTVTDWRGIFVVLAGIGVALLVASARLPESLPPERRRPGGLQATRTAFTGLLRDRGFVGYVLTGGFAFGAMFTYIAGSPFVLQDVYGLSEQAFSITFAVNALGIVAAGALNRVLVARAGPARLLAAGVAVQAAGAALLLVSALADLGLPGLLPGLWLITAPIGLIVPNAAALGMDRHPEVAGSASALIGLVQFAIGAVVAPSVGLIGAASAVPMACIIAVFAAASVAVRATLAR